MEARADPHNEHRDILEEYMSLPEGARAELIDGVIIMQAAPAWDHQRISLRIASQLDAYLRGKRCQIAENVNVRFKENERKPSMFQPDIVVVCDPSKIRPNGIIVGVPDMIVEILSPSNARHDRVLKYNRYQREGVREYWIVSPQEQTVVVNTLENGKYDSNPHGPDEKVLVTVLDDCVIDMAQVFPQGGGEAVGDVESDAKLPDEAGD